MDWIEQWLGYSPDNGDGSLEILITVSLVIAVICVGLATHPAFRAILKRIGRGLDSRWGDGAGAGILREKGLQNL